MNSHDPELERQLETPLEQFVVDQVKDRITSPDIARAEVFLQHIPLADSLFSAAVEVAEKAGATASLEYADIRESQGSTKFRHLHRCSQFCGRMSRIDRPRHRSCRLSRRSVQ